MILQAPGPGVERRAKAAEQDGGDLLRGLHGPAFVVTEGQADWLHWISRAAAGHVVIESVSVVPHHNAWWRLGLYWPEVPQGDPRRAGRVGDGACTEGPEAFRRSLLLMASEPEPDDQLAGEDWARFGDQD